MDVELLTTLLAGAAAILAAIACVVAVRGRDNQSKAAAGSSEVTGRLAQIAETQTAAQTRMAESLQAQERALTKMLDERLAKQAKDTSKTMGDLGERLAIITKAQENIVKLSQDVTGLQEVLSNRHARGAFGETQLEDIVRSALPPDVYAFQKTLSNGSRVDCLLALPEPPGPIAIDAKFPLESYRVLRTSTSEEERVRHRKQFSIDIITHLKAISGKYILIGETAEIALMFLPSEAVYAEIYAELPTVVEHSQKLRVYIVSPTTMMATLNTVRAILKDIEIRKQAGRIRDELVEVGKDTGRLDKRVGNLQRHFGQAEDDMRQIRTSAEKIVNRVDRLEQVQIEDPVTDALDSPGDSIDIPSGMLSDDSEASKAA